MYMTCCVLVRVFKEWVRKNQASPKLCNFMIMVQLLVYCLMHGGFIRCLYMFRTLQSAISQFPLLPQAQAVYVRVRVFYNVIKWS